ncbi:hypothetical protein BJX96DRAFT_172339 [Aspergillus floccosus]
MLPIQPILLSLFPTASEGRQQVAAPCGDYSFPEVTCIYRYGSFLQPGFYREVHNSIGNADTYASTLIVDDPSFSNVENAKFLIWDEDKALEILGQTPELDYMFTIPDAPHEAPVYVPKTHELFFSQLETGFLPQFVVDLKQEPPTLYQKVLHPPIYAPTGARYRNGSIILSAGGLNRSMENNYFVPGIYQVDPVTGHSQPLVNNYFGWYFNTCDDMDIDSSGNIWFTDNFYSWADHTDVVAPQLGTATYRFNPETGQVTIVEDTLVQPNGIAFSPDGRRLYLSDTGAGIAVIDPSVQPVPGLQYNSTGRRTLYALDVSEDGKYVTNKRPIYLALDYAPDGLKVARNGMILTAAGHGVDVLDENGTPLVRVQTNFTAVNMEFVGPNYDELWIVGIGGVARVRWGLKGPVYQ